MQESKLQAKPVQKPKQPREPERRCIGCGSVRGKSELVRLALEDGRVKGSMDDGRGAYLCRDMECVQRALKNKGAFSRAFKTNVEPLTEDELWALVESSNIN
jgi:hypothetical protein